MSLVSLMLSVVTAAVSAQRILDVQITRDTSDRTVDAIADLLAKRDDGYLSPMDIANAGNKKFYKAVLGIGSENQSVSVQVDTGSSDLWVMDSSNPYCRSSSSSSSSIPSADKINCSSQFMFDSSKSTTFSTNKSDPFDITYGDTTFANGTYGQDTVRFSGATIKKANFAVAKEANSSQAVWGIGLETVEAMDTLGADGVPQASYDNLPVQLKQQGYIDHVAYSLWLNTVEASEGQLLFGGVDHAKYNGTLQTVPLVPAESSLKVPIDFSVMLHGITAYTESDTADLVSCSLPVLLDSGTSFAMLPEAFVEAIADSIGAVYEESVGAYVAECSAGDVLTSDTAGLTFDLSGVKINVPFSELLLPAGSTGSETICLLTLFPTSSSYILGDVFLRSAYVVYDLENKEVSLAQVKFNVTSSSIEAISSSVPSATNAPSYSSTQYTSSYDATTATIFGISDSDTSGFGSVTATGLSSADSLATTDGIETGSYTKATAASTASNSQTTASSSSSSSSSSKNGAVNTRIGACSILGSLLTSLLYFL